MNMYMFIFIILQNYMLLNEINVYIKTILIRDIILNNELKRMHISYLYYIGYGVYYLNINIYILDKY